jgi:membrane-associated protease RseP (regulator of RpoE activity)
MSDAQPQFSEQPQTQEQPQAQAAAQPPVSPQPKQGFSGKQVFAIMAGVLVLLAVGLVIGGAIGYRLGTAEGAQQAVTTRRAAQVPSLNQQAPNQPAPNQQAPEQQAPQNQQTPRGQGLPFGQQQLPGLTAGGAYLGVTFQMITPEIAAQEGITGTTGALVREVVPGGPAAQAGLKQGDVVSAVNGQPVNEQDDLRARVASFKPSDEITLTVVKGTANGPTDQHDVKIKLGERPAEQSFDFQLPFGEDGLPALPFGNDGQPAQPNTAPAANGPYLGVEYELITADVAAREAITGTQGALIRTVVADSPAAQAGLKAGDVVSAVDGKAVDETNNLGALVLSHKVGDEITLTVVTGTAAGPTGQHDVKVTLAARPAQREFQLPPGLQPGAPGLDSREG